MAIFNLDNDPDRFYLVEHIIEQLIPEAPDQVKAAIAVYADGNPGAASLLAKECVGMLFEDEVREYVGWSYLEGVKETGSQIYLRLKAKAEGYRHRAYLNSRTVQEEAGGITFPRLSPATNQVMVAVFWNLYDDGEWQRVMNKLGIPEEARIEVREQIAKVNHYFLDRWNRSKEEQ